MTKQEAIETIKLALSQVEWDYPLDYAAAFDMAISAMEKQDAPDTNVDTISRQAAIDAGLRLCGRDTKAELINFCDASIADSEGRAGGILDYISELEDLPPAQPYKVESEEI